MSLLATSVPLIAVNLVASAIWVGGLVVIFVVARTASEVLDPAARVVFFRAFGRAYGVVGTAALLVAYGSGAVLLGGHPWDPLLIATAVVAASLLLTTAVGMAQARAMTRLRRLALAEGGRLDLEPRVREGAVLATFLRAAIGVLTLVLVVLAAALAQ